MIELYKWYGCEGTFFFVYEKGIDGYNSVITRNWGDDYWEKGSISTNEINSLFKPYKPPNNKLCKKLITQIFEKMGLLAGKLNG